MKCYVCNNEFEGNVCPRDNFPKVLFPGDYETGMKKLKPDIDAYRDKFFGAIELGIAIYNWKDGDGAVVLDTESRLPFGTAASLFDSTRWMETQFARIPNEEKLTVNMYIKTDSEERVKKIDIPNLFEPELQRIGIRMENNFSFKLLLGNDTGTPTESEYYSIFD